VNPRSDKSDLGSSSILMVYPNPAANDVTITISSDESANGVVNVLDLDGKLMFSSKVDKNHIKFNIDLTSFASGVYIVKYKTDKGLAQIEKMIVTK